jgi:hypothetical protein
VIVAAIVIAAGLIPSLRAGPSPSNSKSASVAPAPGSGSLGLAASGLQCGPNARQAPWPHYATTCAPALHSDNSGSTAPLAEPQLLLSHPIQPQ